MSEERKFLDWWLGNDERAKCTLEQAIGAYVSTFPGRIYLLLQELLAKHER
jgi:hypothetical protein